MVAPGTGRRAALLLVCAWLLSSCAASSSHGPGAKTISVLLPPSERPFWQPIARRFEAANPGVHVDLVEGPQSTDLRENLYTTSLLARDGTFDLVYLDVTWTPKFAAAGWLRPLDESFAADRERFLAPAWNVGSFEGRLYRIPVRTDMGLLFYRRDWLAEKKIEPPATFAQLATAASELSDPPRRWGYLWQGAQYEGLVCNFLEVLTGYGGYWIDPETHDIGLEDREAIAATRFLVNCARGGRESPPGVTTYLEEESRRVFQDGRAAFLRNWPYAYRLSQAEDSPLRGKVDAILMPYREQGGRPVGTLGGWGLGVSNYSRNPDLAIAFIRHAVSPESQRELCAPTGYAPALAAAYEDTALLRANPFLARFRGLHEHSVARPTVARYVQASDILQRHLSAALAGMETPQVAMELATEETRLLLGPRRPARKAAG